MPRKAAPAVLINPQREDSKRRVRVFDTVSLARNQSSFIVAYMSRERSPRKVGCTICWHVIEGNKEDRITISVPRRSGVGPGLPHWMNKPVKVYFHPQCMANFANGITDKYISGNRHHGLCSHCGRWTSASTDENGNRYCGICSPIASPKAVKRAVKKLKQIQVDLRS